MSPKFLRRPDFVRLLKKSWPVIRPDFLPSGRAEHAIFSSLVGLFGCLGLLLFILVLLRRPTLYSLSVSALMMLASVLLARATWRPVRVDPKRKWVLTASAIFGSGHAVLVVVTAANPFLHVSVYVAGACLALASVSLGAVSTFILVLLDKRRDASSYRGDDRFGKFVDNLRARHAILFISAALVSACLVVSLLGFSAGNLQAREFWMYSAIFVASARGARLIIRALAVASFSDDVMLASISGIAAGLYLAAGRVENSEVSDVLIWIMYFTIAVALRNGASLFMKVLKDNELRHNSESDPNIGYL